jgi:hypothetical protein
VSTDEQLAWEHRLRTRAAAAAGIGALAGFLGRLISYQAYLRGPDDGPGAPLRAADFLHDKSGVLLLGAAVSAVGLLAIAYVLGYLARATRARRPNLHRGVLIVAVSGAVGLAVAQLVNQIAINARVSDFIASGSRNYFEARDLLNTGSILAAQTIGLAATLALGFGFVLISVNAMRVGLITRFLGYLGVFVGLLAVFPIVFPVPIVQTFWLIAIAMMLLQQYPKELPAAWRTGKAEPWPTGRELPSAGGPVDRPPAPAPAGRGPAAAAAAPAPRKPPDKRKRKRRR